MKCDRTVTKHGGAPRFHWSESEAYRERTLTQPCSIGRVSAACEAARTLSCIASMSPAAAAIASSVISAHSTVRNALVEEHAKKSNL
jgi:hypothetical protein